MPTDPYKEATGSVATDGSGNVVIPFAPGKGYITWTTIKALTQYQQSYHDYVDETHAAEFASWFECHFGDFSKYDSYEQQLIKATWGLKQYADTETLKKLTFDVDHIIVQKNAELVDMGDTLNNREDDLTELNKKYDSLGDEATTLTAKIVEQMKEIHELERQINALTDEINVKNREIDNLENQIIELNDNAE